MDDPRPPHPAIVRPGEVLELEEQDYWYGQGKVRLRVDTVVHWPHHNTDAWQVTGVQLFWDGSGKPRTVLVTTKALLRHAVKHGRTAPPRP